MSTEPTSEVESFYEFLGREIANGGRDKPLQSLLDDWRCQHEVDRTVDAVNEGFADSEAGRMTRVRDLLGEAKRALFTIVGQQVRVLAIRRPGQDLAHADDLR